MTDLSKYDIGIYDKPMTRRSGPLAMLGESHRGKRRTISRVIGALFASFVAARDIIPKVPFSQN